MGDIYLRKDPTDDVNDRQICNIWRHDTRTMEFDEIVDALTDNHIPEIMLAAGGIFAIMITMLYLKDRDSAKYKITMLIGLFVGIAMAVIAYCMYETWMLPTLVIVIVASFTLIIRPFREIHFALILALLVIGIVYVMLGELEGTWFEFLSEGWYRIGLAVLCGALAFTVANMVESIVKIAGKILNAWPVLLILGLVCIAEAVMIFMEYGSVYEFIQEMLDKRAQSA